MYKSPSKVRQASLFWDLETMLSPKNTLYKLANLIDWNLFEQSFAPLYSKDTGRMAKPIRLMVGLLILKHLRDVSDESVVEQFSENAYFQYFCGMEAFRTDAPCVPTELVEFRHRIGESGMELILKESIRINLLITDHRKEETQGKDGKDGRGRKPDAEHTAFIDTTVQEKNVPFPTDSKLLNKVIDFCHGVAEKENLKVRQSYAKEIKELKLVQRFRGRKNSKAKVRKADKRMRTIAGRLLRELLRLLPDRNAYQKRIDICMRLVNGERLDGHKIYSLHEPDVLCISKGKEGKKYEFGNKVSIVRLWDGLIIGALSFRNEYDGHTIDKAMEQVRRLYDRKIKTLACDRGYRGQSMSGQTQIIIPDTPKKTDSRYAKNKKHKLFRKRAGIEPIIGHCKADHRLGRNFYKGLFGDSINVMLAAAAFNFKRAMRLLLCLIERVIMWCCGRQELNFQHQFFPQGLFEKCDVAFLRVDYIVQGSDVVAGRAGGIHAFAVNLLSTDNAPLFATFDVNGDGKDDVVCVEQRKKDNYYPCTIVQFAGGTTLDRTDVRLTLPQGINKDIGKVFVGDFNNDGLPDLILLYDGGYKIYFNNGGNAIKSRFMESNTKLGTDFGDYWRIQQGDFDGDGLTDFVYNKSGESCLWIAHNNGNGTFTHTKSVDIGVSDHASCKDDSRFSLMTCDIDHDGRTDVMVCKAGYRHRGFPKFRNEYTNTQVRWLYSTGSGLKSVYSYTKNHEDDANESSIFLGDFDGDGYPELANYGSALNGTNNTFSEKINIYKSGYDLSQVGKITGITDGMGNNCYIQYASATSPAVYKKSIKSTYPVNTYTLPLSVVAKMTSDNGSVGSQTTKYFYENLRLHIAGKGMLGFNTVTNENTTLGTKEVNSITKWDESLWLPTEIKTSSSVGKNTGTVVSTYSVSKSGKNYFTYVSKKNMTDLDGNTVTTISNYDVSKGVLTDEIVMNDGDNMYKKVSYSGYQNKAGVWLPTTLTMSQKHADDPTPYTTVTTYGYDDRGNVLYSTVNSGTSMALKTTSTYDVYGNVLSSVTTGNGVKPITKFNDYDLSGRFVIKSFTNPASTVNTFTYDLWGNVLTESDATEPSNILTTRYTYDGWGRRLTAEQADGTQTTYETGWGFTDNKTYYTMESTTGKPSVTMWYDKGGYEVLQESFGAKGMPVSKATIYNDKGQVSRVENKTGKLTITQNLTYDERGRVMTDVLSSGKSVSYSYGNRSVTTTIAGRSYTKTTDAWGNVVKSTDPVSEVEYQYSSIGKPSRVTTQGSTVTMTYDAAGNQLSLSDPDAGISHYTYAADGTLLTQTDGRGIKTINSYDELGRLASTQIGQKTIVYTYGTVGNEKLRLVKQAVDNNSVEYIHDKFGRVISEKRTADGYGSYGFSYAYNSNNQLAKTTYPGGLEVSYLYDDYGFKTQSAIGDKVIYKVENADGLVNSTSFMGKLTAMQTRDERGYESNVKVMRGTSVLETFDETYDGATDNLLSRKRNNSPQESFIYDDLDRLVSVKSGATETMRINYAPNGNILFKTGVGNFSYDQNVRPHAVTEVENADGQIPGDALNTSFNDFGKIQLIEDVDKSLRMDFAYGPDQERWYSALSKSGTDVRTTIYAGEYEKITENGKTREFYYLDGNTIVIRENGTVKTYLAFTDNLGSILSVMDENGAKVFDASYDAWGRQTVTLSTIGLHRGYTGHEMLNEFDIINMNGRLYDPVLGRFFSPDNYVQMPDNSQNFNRYSYCLNNPLKYTDPSGNLFGIDDVIIAFAAFNMASSMMQAAFEGKSVWKAGALSLLSSAASYGIGAAFGGVSGLGNELLRAGAHGLASGVVSALDGGNFASAFVSGAAASGIGSFAQGVNMNAALMIVSTTAMGGVVASATGGDFLQGAMQGMTIGLFNHAMHNDGNVIGGNSICERLPDGTYVAPTDLREVIVYGHRKLAYTPNHPIEKPLREIHPEFDVLMLGRAFFQGAIQAIRAEGKSVSHYIKSETGGIHQWIRKDGVSHSISGNFDTKSIRWGSNSYYRNNIGSPYLRNLNERLRNSRIPINSWRTADKGHFHLKWGYRDADEWHWFRR